MESPSATSETLKGCGHGSMNAADRWLSIASSTRSCAATGSAKSSPPAVGISACAGIRDYCRSRLQIVPIVQNVLNGAQRLNGLNVLNLRLEGTEFAEFGGYFNQELFTRALRGREKKSKLGDVKSFSHVGGFLSCRKPSVLKWLSRFGHAVGLISRPNSRFSPLHELLLPFQDAGTVATCLQHRRIQMRML